MKILIYIGLFSFMILLTFGYSELGIYHKGKTDFLFGWIMCSIWVEATRLIKCIKF